MGWWLTALSQCGTGSPGHCGHRGSGVTRQADEGPHPDSPHAAGHRPADAECVGDCAATEPIRLIVPNPPGGPLDLVARALADKLRDTLCVVIAKYERVVKASGAKVE